MTRRILLSWSSGKDSAFTLLTLQKDPSVEVVALLTTINADANRVAMHAVRHSLLKQQAKLLGLPLLTAKLPWPCTNSDYEKIFINALYGAQEKFQITHVAYGDLFLEDIRSYRISLMEKTTITALFPLWKIPTSILATDMLDQGIRAVITCVDKTKLSLDYLGKTLTLDLTKNLPSEIDPCGENGEFHTFVYEAPIFSRSIPIIIGDIVDQNDFATIDILAG